MRTALCVAGVALATTFVIAVGATTLRYTAVIKEISVLFNGQVMIADKSAIVIQAIPLGGSTMPQNYTEEMVRSVIGVKKTVPILFITPIGLGDIIRIVPVNFSMGIPVADFSLILGPTPLKGNNARYPANESSNEVLVGASLADQYNWTAGSEITLSTSKLKVVGILDTKLALLNRCIIMPLRLAQKIYHYEGSVNIIAATPAQGYSQVNISRVIENRISYVQALTDDERNDIIQPILAQIETWNLGLQAIVFLMSLILVMTVTIMSVSERRRDFATLDAVGAPLSYTFRIVILEASLIGVLGGVIGVASGSLAALFMASLYTNIPISLFFSSLFDVVPPVYALEIFVSVIAVCCIGGIIPAINATRLRIAEALRAEY